MILNKFEIKQDVIPNILILAALAHFDLAASFIFFVKVIRRLLQKDDENCQMVMCTLAVLSSYPKSVTIFRAVHLIDMIDTIDMIDMIDIMNNSDD
jgi:hypothetical protein